MLAVALDSHDENRWYLDFQTGDDCRAMEDFVSGLKQGEARRDLERVLRRAKPFRNFREALRDWPEVRDPWFAVRERRLEDTARAWLADHEIEAIPRAESA